MDDDEEFYTRYENEKRRKIVELSLSCQQDKDSFTQSLSNNFMKISAYSPTSAKSEIETKSIESLIIPNYDFIDDRSSVLFNESILTWNSRELPESHGLSLDSGFNSSFNDSSSSFSSTDNLIEPQTQLIHPTVFFFDQFIGNLNTRFDFLSGVGLLATIPSMLNRAFVSWSKSSFKRLSYSVLNHLDRVKSCQYLQYDLNEETVVIESSNCVATPSYYKISLISLIRNLQNFSFKEYRSNFMYMFYSYHCFNF